MWRDLVKDGSGIETERVADVGKLNRIQPPLAGFVFGDELLRPTKLFCEICLGDRGLPTPGSQHSKQSLLARVIRTVGHVTLLKEGRVYWEDRPNPNLGYSQASSSVMMMMMMMIITDRPAGWRRCQLSPTTIAAVDDEKCARARRITFMLCALMTIHDHRLRRA